MDKVLISLVGGRPLPNVLVTLHIKPRYLYFIVSKDSAGSGRDYEKTISALPEHFKPEHQIVKPYELQETQQACLKFAGQHPNHEILIHTTSGPKTMAFGAYDAAKYLIQCRNPRPLGVVRVRWLCLKNALEIAVAKP